MKLFNPCLRQNQARLDCKDMLLVVEIPPGLSPLCPVLEKCAIWHFGLSRIPRNKFARQYARQ